MAKQVPANSQRRSLRELAHSDARTQGSHPVGATRKVDDESDTTVEGSNTSRLLRITMVTHIAWVT